MANLQINLEEPGDSRRPSIRRGDGAPARRILPGLVVIGMPIVLGTWLLLTSLWETGIKDGLPENGIVTNALGVALHPAVSAYGYLILPLTIPPILSGLGIGSIIRWLVLSVFCLASAAVCFLMVLVFFAADLSEINSNAVAVFSLAFMLGIFECCGCLLAAGFGISSER
ncbi:hypothetical protein [Tautonia rosea]|uniref:hypothetical protein n=1 Tax=Tautonia rosea TaxID=2728037 RepID=UPI001474D1BB|nr:hypothetical protein [Tautonia rosea]